MSFRRGYDHIVTLLPLMVSRLMTVQVHKVLITVDVTAVDAYQYCTVALVS